MQRDTNLSQNFLSLHSVKSPSGEISGDGLTRRRSVATPPQVSQATDGVTLPYMKQHLQPEVGGSEEVVPAGKGRKVLGLKNLKPRLPERSYTLAPYVNE